MPGAKGKGINPPPPWATRHTDPASGVSVEVVNQTPLQQITDIAQSAADRGIKRAFGGKKKGNPAWVKGVSQNPGGALALGKFYFQCRNIFKEASPDIARAAVELALDPAADERVRSVLIVACLDRAGLKPMDYDPAQDQPQPTWDPGSLDPDEREQLKTLLAKMVKK